MLRYSAVLLATAIAASAQNVQVTKDNKTITITAEETLTFQPDAVRLSLGRDDYAATYDEAFIATKSAILRIVDVLHQAGVKDEQVSSDSITVSEAPVLKDQQGRRFHSSQKLRIAVPATDAQALLDSCINAGANDVSSPEWLLSDETKAQAKTAGAALKKARLTAQQMAEGLGAKLGELVYASNTVPEGGGGGAFRVGGAAGGISGGTYLSHPRPQPKLILFPKPVEVKATVYATFAIQ